MSNRLEEAVAAAKILDPNFVPWPATHKESMQKLIEVLDDVTWDVFIEFLAQHPSHREYNFYLCDGECLGGQFLAFIGVPWSIQAYRLLCLKLLPGCGDVCYQQPHTFGGAMTRALGKQAEQQNLLPPMISVSSPNSV